jgi:hypothetical protein
VTDGFLGRWSRRKRGLEQEPPEAASPPEAGPAPAAEPEFDPASLPPLESLDAGGDLTAFLHPKVPPLLRQTALRRAWAADPGIRDFVGPADYAWDYNAPDGVPGFSFDLGDVDMKKLLAQMIGEPQEPPPAEPEPEATGPEAPAPEAPDTQVPTLDLPALPQPLLAQAAPPPLADSPLRLSDPAPVAELPDGAPPRDETGHEPAPPPARRRHGGALPRLG